MAIYPCASCGGGVNVDTRHLGPVAAQALLVPVDVLGSDCVHKLGLDVKASDSRQYVVFERREFRAVGGAFARSTNPRVAHVYTHDEK